MLTPRVTVPGSLQNTLNEYVLLSVDQKVYHDSFAHTVPNSYTNNSPLLPIAVYRHVYWKDTLERIKIVSAV